MPNRIFEALAGEWTVARTLTKIFAGNTIEAHMHGKASFNESSQDQYLYSESVESQDIVSTGQTVTATKELVYKFNANTNSMHVYRVNNDDGSALKLYEVDVGNDSAMTTCSHAGTKYTMLFSFPTATKRNSFSVSCTASGAENYKTLTEFSKVVELVQPIAAVEIPRDYNHPAFK